MNLGENIYKNRTKMNWSQTDLADELDVSRQSVSKWENNTAIPDLDKLMKMSSLFEVSLDTLVFGEEKQQQAEPSQVDVAQTPAAPTRHAQFPTKIFIGVILFIFGAVLFLLSMFWGNHLSFGEEFGELFSATIVLFSVSLIATYDFKVLAICSVIYFLYSVICYGIFDVTSIYSHLFSIIMSGVIIVWFLVCGLHTNQGNTGAEQ